MTDLITLLPLVVVLSAGVIILLIDLFIPKDRKRITAMLAAVGLAAGLGVNVALSGTIQTGFHDMVVLDGFAVFANTLILIAGLAGIAIASDFLQRMRIERSEFYPLLMFSTSGMMLLVQAYDLIVFFLAIELLSIPLYVLAGLARPKAESEEAALKYFILGAMSSAILFYGIALIYAGTAQTGFLAIVEAAANPIHPLLFVVGAAMLLVGLAFKLAAVPFHMWAPDVYQGTPTPISGWMAVGVKVAGFAALLRVFVMAFPSLAAYLSPILLVISALTMLVGNLTALVQTNIKRLLAYSSIANVGYILMAFVPYANGEVTSNAISATLFYLAGYLFTSFAAWSVVTLVERSDGSGQAIEDFAGLGLKHPWLGAIMVIAMLSFTGIPPTLGFWGKFFVFRATIEGGNIGLAVLGVLTSLLSAYYYLRVILVMYFKPGQPEVRREPWTYFVATLSAAGTLILAFFPYPILQNAVQAVMKLF